MSATTMMASYHDDQLGEIYAAMLNELNCTFGVSFSRLHCCGHHVHGLWPSWFVAVMVYAHGIYGAGLDVCCLLLGLTVTKSCCNDWFERFRVLFCNNCSISRPLHHYHDADHAVSCRLFVTKIGDVCRKFYRPFVNAFHLS